LTDEKGQRTYLYILNLYEKIKISDYIENVENDKFAYIPIAICLVSYVSNTDTFKSILLEAYKITLHDKELNENETCKNSNLLNFFIFLNNIINPFSYSRMTLNMQHSAVDIYFNSKCELPESDSNIKILFDCLDISTVIKLWCSILLEKQVNSIILDYYNSQSDLSPFCYL
jgi:hypothetical protein